MGVPCRLALVFAFFAFVPAAEAAPILTGGLAGDDCTATVPTQPNCGIFDLGATLGTTTLTGTFDFDNDVALFQFVLGAGTYTFDAFTTSAAAVYVEDSGATGFDPMLALFREGVQVTYPGPDGEQIPALALDPVFDMDVALPTLILSGNATYTLALSQYGNFPLGTLADGFDQSDFSCFTAPDLSCAPGGAALFESGAGHIQTGDFAVNLTVNPVDTASVPEPGTLSLLALGSLGAGLMRRRARRRATRPALRP